MSWFRNLRMAFKLGACFAILVLLVACTGFLGLRGLGQVNERTADVAQHADGLNHLQEANGELLRISRAVRNAILDTDVASVDKRASDIRKYESRFRTDFDAYQKTIAKSDTKVKAAELERQFNELRPLQDEIVALARAQKDEEARAGLPRIRAMADAMDEKINELVESKQSLIRQAKTDADATYAQVHQLVLVVVIGACVLATVLGFTLSHLTARPLQQTKILLEAVAKGDLTQHADVRSTDEVGQMASALNTAIDTLRAARERDADYVGQITAVSKVQAVIEFRLDGTIVSANENFLRTMGYSLPEIQGRHHSMFADPALAASLEYRAFWAKLNRGEYIASEFKRLGKGGKEVWIQASYNPILDLNGKPYKVVKYATDVTVAKLMERQVRENAEQDKARAIELQQKVAAITTSVSALADGDFTQPVPDLGADEVGQMAHSLNKAVVSVRTALEGVREVSEQLADASAQLSTASEEISTGAQEQASSLEETASTLEEITATVRQNSDSAQQARQLASSSRDVAEKGGQVVGNAVEAMSEINQSSKKIADIITTIDEIAFQTNLLALNAAVEAARAGEQGRGFAVVASEVRNLAQRSATSAKEIKTLIEDSVKKVDAGTELVNQSGTTLGDIVTSVKRVTDIITEIAAAGKEQSVGIEQVNKSVSQMDSITQRNASQTEEMSATAQTLTDQAAHLRDLVARFKLSGSGAPAPKVMRPKAPITKPRSAVVRALKNGHSNGHGRSHELDRLGSDDHDGFTEF
ncbi:chemotaxis partial : Globin-coupled methyl-accepting chemotaxis protein (Modular protein) OS=Candidatus Nitrospira defluvii GN=cheM PE=3 SV=1: 4HB_MCP_1: HAMP: PAS_9: HAMP: MCPsignal [Gemmata massiliana]|uniref:Uncharacterized protein n=1 Tax=Gemmata massiliana TaxID=1210884 RepID=A0A6P2DLT7_9BACT|nr:methyl-accepting chemotaxis protein [Gemmata massiliana]VTS03853.1 chemotaxis partial : Globin-coupled methyl-accepting chemotaxis protein (Modular protein) OS=Candidatus Nitrospira defluvii GN=cheM PE=3 SV=1: 4HB_MCP_1: HAMP: PAS_9: HAMP: MCPsignal [Gemmata massiliana]